MSETGPAFPAPAKNTGHLGFSFDGLSKREYAAIHLRVPNSGTDWLDEMIIEALRTELAAKAMQGLIGRGWEKDGKVPDDVFERWAAGAYKTADAMLAERGRK